MKTTAWDKFALNSLVARCLVENNMTNPTDIQSASLPYYQFKTDLILAAKTGSGKTLCFGIPILSDLINEFGLEADYDGEAEINPPKRKNARALILTPTRELAIQIMHHMEKLNKYTKKHIKIGVVVGGLSREKQLRILSRNPQILIATPGRLWDFLESEPLPYLQTLKKINYLVLDEADKMIELGHFKEMDKILSIIYSKEIQLKENAFTEEGREELMEGLYIKGPGGKVISLNDPSLNLIGEDDGNPFGEQAKDEEEGDDFDENDIPEEDEEEAEDAEGEGEEDYENAEQEEGDFEEEEVDGQGEGEDFAEEEQEEIEEEAEENEEGFFRKPKKSKKSSDGPTWRRTIVLSATLANSGDVRDNKKDKKSKKSRRGKGNDKGRRKDSGKRKENSGTSKKLEVLMKKIQFHGKPKLIDLTAESKLPETLQEFKCVCTDEQKVLYIYSFIRRNADKSFIVFTNTIPAAKRVYSILMKLDVKAVCLHSEMQQRQRLKKLEKFANKESLVLVCTDVASRGLDIPVVNFVIHYQIPKDSDTYVHRSGRTARIGREGTAYALVAPGDKANYLNICKQLRDGQGIDTIQLSKLEMDKVTEMVEAASKLEKGEFFLDKKKKHAEWFQKNAKEADIMLDEEIEEEIEDVKEEVTKKKKVLKNNNVSYQKIKQTTGRKMVNPTKSRAIFLDYSQVANIASMLSNPGTQKTATPTNRQQHSRNSSTEGRNRSRSRNRKH